MRQLIATLLSVWLVSCGQKQRPSEIVIEGHVKDIPNGKIYLTEAHRWNVFLDSTIATNGHFRFVIKPNSSFVPYMASICFPDSTWPTKIRQLSYANEFNLPKGLTKGSYNFTSSFYLERGMTQIYEAYDSNISSNSLLKIKAGKENELFYKDEVRDFGWMGQATSDKRSARINLFKRYIEDHSFSYFLLQSIFDAKEQYSEQEMSDLLALFDKDVQDSGLGDRIRNYLALRHDSGTPVSNLFLLGSDRKRQYILDKEAKINMLIFWASWCQGCREEIPIFKEVYDRYTGKPVSMVSISMDEHKKRWYKAMAHEQMQWPQYIVHSNQLDVVRQRYNFSAIPLIVLTDSSGREIKRFLGNKSNNSMPYVTVIDGVLSRKDKTP